MFSCCFFFDICIHQVQSLLFSTAHLISLWTLTKQSCLNTSLTIPFVPDSLLIRPGFDAVLYKKHSLSENYTVINTHLEAKMKTFTAFLLLSAFATYVSASEMEFHIAVFDFLDERHDERMAQVLRDQGLPENTLVARDHGKEIPPWMVSR